MKMKVVCVVIQCLDCKEVFFEDFLPSKKHLGGGFKYFLFSPLFGEDFEFD